ncbi:hypothetical protein F0562_002228 [Nyssa sinensis]|uniref:Bifunctional inhibitor/plant lipid transfer protein/seed storage helical domain-containing protein n=1 Tax=Nyssa sinensis TaxID=561372 RepID=A0A5J5C6S9_9ASTE|nr:hypothetical protein F0562_002228 [Nyssa sinensis]
MEMGRKVMLMVVVVMVMLGESKALELCNMNEDEIHSCCPLLGLILILPWHSLSSATSPLLPIAKACRKAVVVQLSIKTFGRLN